MTNDLESLQGSDAGAHYAAMDDATTESELAGAGLAVYENLLQSCTTALYRLVLSPP